MRRIEPTTPLVERFEGPMQVLLPQMAGAMAVSAALDLGLHPGAHHATHTSIGPPTAA